MGTALVVWRKHPVNPHKHKRRPRLRTICEVLRELYRDAEARGDALSMVKLDEANDMAKRMHNRLVELSPNEPYIVSEKK
jgi:hypothetical protein